MMDCHGWGVFRRRLDRGAGALIRPHRGPRRGPMIYGIGV